jgi:hypothetical protein
MEIEFREAEGVEMCRAQFQKGVGFEVKRSSSMGKGDKGLVP